METKQYKIAVSPEAAKSAGIYWNSYHEAETEKDRINEVTGMGLEVYKVVTTVTVADRVSEDYWEYR